MLAKEYGLSTDSINRIVRSPFYFAKHVMEKESDRSKCYFPSIRIPYFGLFFCPEKVKEKFKKKNHESISSKGL